MCPNDGNALLGFYVGWKTHVSESANERAYKGLCCILYTIDKFICNFNPVTRSYSLGISHSYSNRYVILFTGVTENNSPL